MYTSKYYTCEQIDQRLLQGYLDDYNQQNNLSLTKEEFLTLIYNMVQNEKYLSVKNSQNLTNLEKARGLENLGIPVYNIDILKAEITRKLRIMKEENGELKDAGFIGISRGVGVVDNSTFLIQTSQETGDKASEKPTDIMVRAKNGEVMIESDSLDHVQGKSYISLDKKPGNGIWIKEGVQSNLVPSGTIGGARSSIHLVDSDIHTRAMGEITTESVDLKLYAGEHLNLEGNTISLNPVSGLKVHRRGVGSESLFGVNSTPGGAKATFYGAKHYIESGTNMASFLSNGELYLKSREFLSQQTTVPVGIIIEASSSKSQTLGKLRVKTNNLFIKSESERSDSGKAYLINSTSGSVGLVTGNVTLPKEDVKSEDLWKKENTYLRLEPGKFKVFLYLGENDIQVNPIQIDRDKTKISYTNIPGHTISNIDLDSSRISFYNKDGKFNFKYKDANDHEVVLDLLAKIQELEGRIAALEGNA